MRVTRWRGLLAVAGSLLALALVMVGLPRPASQAAQGQLWLTGVPWAGVLQTNTGTCSVTVVSEWLAITAKHCGTVNPHLKLGVASAKEPGHDYAVKTIEVNRDMDVQAIFLRDRTGLSVTPLREVVDRKPFYAWGYGADWSNRVQGQLTRADFDMPQACEPRRSPGEKGNLCWQTSAKNSVCSGDTGGPISQDGAIIGMQVRVWGGQPGPNGLDCSTVNLGQALTVQQMQPWLNQMINDADPFP